MRGTEFGQTRKSLNAERRRDAGFAEKNGKGKIGKNF
jgi:hypothetical protein